MSHGEDSSGGLLDAPWEQGEHLFVPLKLKRLEEACLMKSDHLSFRPGFRLSVSNAKSQGAVMVLAVGGKEGGPDNSHGGADQWLYVVEGTGIAIINGHKTSLKAGTMILIE